LDVLKAKEVESGVPLHGNELIINKLIFWFRVHLYKCFTNTEVELKLVWSWVFAFHSYLI
jgi:hypothetical protein